MLALLFFLFLLALLAFLWVLLLERIYRITNSDCSKISSISCRTFSQPKQQDFRGSSQKTNRTVKVYAVDSLLICEGHRRILAAKPDVEALDERNWTHRLQRIIWIILHRDTSVFNHRGCKNPLSVPDLRPSILKTITWTCSAQYFRKEQEITPLLSRTLRLKGEIYSQDVKLENEPKLWIPWRCIYVFGEQGWAGTSCVISPGRSSDGLICTPGFVLWSKRLRCLLLFDLFLNFGLQLNSILRISPASESCFLKAGMWHTASSLSHWNRKVISHRVEVMMRRNC